MSLEFRSHFGSSHLGSSTCEHPWLCPRTCEDPRRPMVVQARLEWIRRLIASGAHAQVVISSAAENGKGKFKIIVAHGMPPTPPVVREILTAQIDHLLSQSRWYIAVDRGHRHASTNTSEVNIWLAPFPQPVSGASGGDDFDYDGHETLGQVLQLGPLPRRRVRCVPKSRVTPLLRDSITPTWKNWRPTTETAATTSLAATSSITPDLPTIRTRTYPRISVELPPGGLCAQARRLSSRQPDRTAPSSLREFGHRALLVIMVLLMSNLHSQRSEVRSNVLSLNTRRRYK